MPEKQLITFENVTYAYPENGEDGEKKEVISAPALDNISFSVKKGEFVAILGANGSGKSTLAKHCNAILTPKSGRVLVNGMDTTKKDDLLNIRKTVGMVFQNPDNQLVATLVEEDVAFAPENLGMDPKEIRERVDCALKEVDMYEYRSHAPHKLSGGQKQRVAIAGILAMQPECIVLDESTAMLDPAGREEVMNILHKLHKKGTTLIHITHFMEEAADADRVIILANGRLLLDGTPKEAFSKKELLKEAGLELPSATKLAEELQKLGVPVSSALSLDTLVEEIISLQEDAS